MTFLRWIRHAMMSTIDVAAENPSACRLGRRVRGERDALGRRVQGSDTSTDPRAKMSHEVWLATSRISQQGCGQQCRFAGRQPESMGAEYTRWLCLSFVCPRTWRLV
jgi:hypothetical protein